MRKLLLTTSAFLIACSAQAHTTDANPPSEVQDIYNIAVEASPDRIQSDIQRGAGYSLNLKKSQKNAAAVLKSFMSLTP